MIQYSDLIKREYNILDDKILFEKYGHDNIAKVFNDIKVFCFFNHIYYKNIKYDFQFGGRYIVTL